MYPYLRLLHSGRISTRSNTPKGTWGLDTLPGAAALVSTLLHNPVLDQAESRRGLAKLLVGCLQLPQPACKGTQSGRKMLSMWLLNVPSVGSVCLHTSLHYETALRVTAREPQHYSWLHTKMHVLAALLYRPVTAVGNETCDMPCCEPRSQNRYYSTRYRLGLWPCTPVLLMVAALLDAGARVAP